MSLVKLKINRPKGSKDKEINPGMGIFIVNNGELEARYRAKKGSQLIGYAVDQIKNEEEWTVALL
jgi:hypothetical protein